MELYLHCTVCYFVPYSLSVMSTFLFIVCLLVCIVTGQGKHIPRKRLLLGVEPCLLTE